MAKQIGIRTTPVGFDSCSHIRGEITDSTGKVKLREAVPDTPESRGDPSLFGCQVRQSYSSSETPLDDLR